MNEKLMATKLTPKAVLVLDFLKSADAPATGAAIAEATGIAAQGVHGIVSRSLIARGFAEKADKVNLPFVDKKGNTVEKSYVTYQVTEAGASYEQE